MRGMIWARIIYSIDKARGVGHHSEGPIQWLRENLEDSTQQKQYSCCIPL